MTSTVSSDKQVRVLLVEDNLVSARLQEGMLAHSDYKSFRVQRAETLVVALELLAKEEFDIAILDLSLPDSNGIETFLAVHRTAPALPVIVVTGIADEAVALNAVRQGAQDFLVKTELNRDRLTRALNYALARSESSGDHVVEPHRTAPLIGLIGSKGGVGTTTLACHVALELNSQTNNRVLLAELDSSSAVTTFLTNARSRYTLLDSALNLHRLDTALLKGFVCSVREGVDLLQAPGAGPLSDPPAAERIRHVFRFAKSQYDWVVLDLGRLSVASMTILEEVSYLLLVTTPELTALREANSALQKLLHAGFPAEQLKLVLNRRAKSMGFSPEEMEKAIGHQVYATFGEYTDELEEAYADGRFLDKNLKLSREAGKLVLRLRGVDDGKKASGLKLFKNRLLRS